MGEFTRNTGEHPTALGTVFTERQVEGLLYAHLRRTGFSVNQKVKVSSGIIDAVAERGGSRTFIEVKGEDRGGYTSAQMNFQMAIGQISSRMTDPAAAYAVAFPLTPDYVRVLRTFRDSFAFELLGLVLYAVSRDGSVQDVLGPDVRTWVDTLPARLQRPAPAV
jgi:Holliday junction resolvase-like predicted endonuclease